MNSLPITPNWGKTMSPEAAEAELVDFKFSGPGIYLGKNDSLLVVRVIDSNHRWHSKHTPGELYNFYMWTNFDVSDLINALSNAPVRLDERN